MNCVPINLQYYILYSIFDLYFTYQGWKKANNVCWAILGHERHWRVRMFCIHLAQTVRNCGMNITQNYWESTFVT